MDPYMVLGYDMVQGSVISARFMPGPRPSNRKISRTQRSRPLDPNTIGRLGIARFRGKRSSRLIVFSKVVCRVS